MNTQRLLNKRNLPDLPDARQQMVDLLRSMNEFDERVLDAMMTVPRHAFAPPNLWRMAYSDVELWGPTAFLQKPSVIAKIANAILDAEALKVLEYATGGGYTTSILSLISESVFTVEHDPWQLWYSSDAFRELEINNITQKASDGKLGWPELAPFDAIVLSAAIPRILPQFISQLKLDGILIAPVGPFYGPHRLIKCINKPAQLETIDLGPCFAVPLTGVWTPLDFPIMSAASEESERRNQHSTGEIGGFPFNIWTMGTTEPSVEGYNDNKSTEAPGSSNIPNV